MPSADKPLLGVPVLRDTEPIGRLFDGLGDSVRWLIIDNSEGGIEWQTDDKFSLHYLPEGAWLVQPYNNLGCAGAWNSIIRQAPTEPYWLIANADAEVGPKHLEYIVSEMSKGGPRWVGVHGDWRLMGLTAEWVETVGWFDERFHPIYLEDTDMEYRGTLAGAEWYNDHHTGQSEHQGGASWKGTDLERQNTRTYRSNANEYQRKWGGGWRGGEVFTTPFDSGQADLCGPPLSRLRGNAWELARDNGQGTAERG